MIHAFSVWLFSHRITILQFCCVVISPLRLLQIKLLRAFATCLCVDVGFQFFWGGSYGGLYLTF